MNEWAIPTRDGIEAAARVAYKLNEIIVLYQVGYSPNIDG